MLRLAIPEPFLWVSLYGLYLWRSRALDREYLTVHGEERGSFAGIRFNPLPRSSTAPV
jgi:hypothetical protein